jgi:hypothetical protein
MPAALEKARNDAAKWEQHREARRDEIAHTASKGREKQKVRVVGCIIWVGNNRSLQDLVIRSGKAANRPLIHFMDVGSKLLNVKEEEKRQRLIDRRGKANAKARAARERKRAIKYKNGAMETSASTSAVEATL